ncbi:MAG: 6-carboxytetrahydropterin synthase [Proteobacteria bacterium]|nr:6-carboxytetrahydropterin synthase [Pseudomonadota bacterium]NBP16814.1 6-carboxytetrahydropterin synthase [bacterium]
MKFQSTKLIELGSCAFRQWRANHSHCRYIHGYQLKAKLWFNCSSLDDKNWAVDFGGLKELKAKLQNQFDHTYCIAADDPELATFEMLDKKGIIQLRVFQDGVGIERTAEYVFNVANQHVKDLTQNRCWVDRVEVFEHEENSAIYSEGKSINLPPAGNEVPSNEAPGLQSSTAAPVGNTVTTGYSNPFAGTRWG